MKIRSVEAIGPIGRYRYDDNTASYLAEAINKQTAMDAVIYAHKSGLIGAATFAKLIRVRDPNDQLDQFGRFDDSTSSYLAEAINKQTAMGAVIYAHKSGLIGAATFAKLVKVYDPNDQLDQLAEYIGYTVDECAKRDERGDVRDK